MQCIDTEVWQRCHACIFVFMTYVVHVCKYTYTYVIHVCLSYMRPWHTSYIYDIHVIKRLSYMYDVCHTFMIYVLYKTYVIRVWRMSYFYEIRHTCNCHTRIFIKYRKVTIIIMIVTSLSYKSYNKKCDSAENV